MADGLARLDCSLATLQAEKNPTVWTSNSKSELATLDVIS